MTAFASIIWAAVAGLCAVGFGIVTGIFHPEEKVNGLWLVVAAACFYVLAYRFYGRFLARRVVELDNRRITPAHRLNDGANFHPTNRWVLFGHHFAAIAGAGPLLGPVLAAQFGYLPGFLWLVVGAALAAWAGGRDVGDRRRHAGGGRHQRPRRGSVFAGGMVRSGALHLGLAAGGLRISRVGPADLDAAGPARLSLQLHEGQRRRTARRRGDRDGAADRDAPRDRLHHRRRADHPRADLPLRVHHHRLRGDLGVPLAGGVRHDAQDDRPGVARVGRVRGHVNGRLRGGDRADRRVPPRARRLLRHQYQTVGGGLGR